MDRRAWRATVHGIFGDQESFTLSYQSQISLSDPSLIPRLRVREDEGLSGCGPEAPPLTCAVSISAAANAAPGRRSPQRRVTEACVAGSA